MFFCTKAVHTISSLSESSEASFAHGIICYLFIEIRLIYNVVIVSGVQQSDSVIYIYSFSDSFPL